MTISLCPACDGQRLRPEILAVYWADRSIAEVTAMAVRETMDFLTGLQLDEREAFIGRQVIKEITERLRFLIDVGLDYLTLDRPAGSLSGGEAQRIRLATQVGSSLVGVLYVLDEPSIGLHARDNERLLTTLKRLRDLGNTVIVVEHDEETIHNADYIVDIGPGAGIHGGEVVAVGTVEEIMQAERSITGRYSGGSPQHSGAGAPPGWQRPESGDQRGAGAQSAEYRCYYTPGEDGGHHRRIRFR